MDMRVAREFQSSTVIHKLETVQEEALEAFLETAPQDPTAIKLREWQIREIEAGLAEAEAGDTVPHEKVVAWVESWGTENELPKPE
jgi:predicted transcriptional regulator